jgi:uncharacterized protein (TIGR02647 family)
MRLNTLARFDLATSQQGIKVHKTASPEVIAATRRLHEKGLLTLPDGGYLTGLGRDAAEHAQSLLMTPCPRGRGSGQHRLALAVPGHRRAAKFA